MKKLTGGDQKLVENQPLMWTKVDTFISNHIMARYKAEIVKQRADKDEIIMDVWLWRSKKMSYCKKHSTISPEAHLQNQFKS